MQFLTLFTKAHKLSSIGLCWVFIALAVSPGFGDGYTQIKTFGLGMFFCWSALRLEANFLWPRFFVLGGGLLVLSYLLSIALNLPGNYRLVCLEWLGFAVSTCFVLQTLQRGRALLDLLIAPVRISLGFVLLYQLIQECGYQPIQGLWRNDFAASTFGFQNMLAEFYGLSLSALWIRSQTTGRKFKWDQLLFLLGLVGLISTASRTAALAVGVMLFVSLFFLPKPRTSVLTLIIAFGIAIPAGRFLTQSPNTQQFFGLLSEKPVEAQQPAVEPAPTDVIHRVAESKSQTAFLRWIRLRNSMVMVKDAPFGIGPGNFEFGYLPYRSAFKVDWEANAYFVPRSPHNGFLELAIENGIPALLAVLVLGVWFAVQVMRHRRKGREFSPDEIWCFGLLAFLIVDCALAFPFEIPVPMFAWVLALALALHFLNQRTTEHHVSLKVPLLKPVKTSLSFILFAAFGLAALPYAEGQSESWLASRWLSCNIFPEQWQPCLKLGYFEVERNEPQRAHALAQTMLKGRPHHFPARLLQASTAYLMYRDEELCEALRLYTRDTGETMTVSRLTGMDRMGSSPSGGSPADDLCR